MNLWSKFLNNRALNIETVGEETNNQVEDVTLKRTYRHFDRIKYHASYEAYEEMITKLVPLNIIIYNFCPQATTKAESKFGWIEDFESEDKHDATYQKLCLI